MMGAWDPQAQAEAELAALEERRRANDEKEKKKEIEHLAKMIRSGARSVEDNKGCANILCLWGILNGLLWAVPLLGDVWWTKIWHGLSVDKLQITIGLFNMHTAVTCKDNFVGERRLCNAIQPFADHEDGTGNWAMKELRDYMCKKDPESCGDMERMMMAGQIPVFGLPAAAAFEVLAVLLLFFYWSGKPTTLVRNLSNKCAVLACICGNLTCMGWLVVCPYMTTMPRRWAAMNGDSEFANSSLFGLKETFTLPAGWCFLVLMLAMTSSMIRFFCQFTMEVHHNDPGDFGGADESSRLIAEAEALYGDGKA